MVNSERQLTIREISDDEEFGAWLHETAVEYPSQAGSGLEEHHLVLSDEIGDWIGGLRYLLRGGVAQIVQIGVTPSERGRGHALRLLEGFEAAAHGHDAHVIEFWTDHLGLEPILETVGWQRVISRDGYIGGDTWHLFEKRLPATDPASA